MNSQPRSGLHGLLRPSLLVLLVLVLQLPGCASGLEGRSVGPLPGGNLLLAEEIEAVERGTAFEVIEVLRPQWLRMRSEQSVTRDGGIVVYLNDSKLGGIEMLRQLAPRGILRIERFNTTAASQRWGPGHSDGVILVTTLATRE